MTTDDSLLEDNVIFQSFGPLDEALHFGVIYIWLTFVVTCVGISYSSLACTSRVTTAGTTRSRHRLSAVCHYSCVKPVMNVSVSQLLVR